jgi:ABC-type uncharacterized transport system auxiliary subunit
MLKKIILSLSLCASCAFLLIACGGSETPSPTNTSTTANANKATTTTTTPTTSSPTVAASPASTTTASSGEKIGVPECDDYIAKYEACLTSKVPEATRATLKASFDTTRESWKKAATTPQSKASLAQACKTAMETARTAMKSYGCDF